MSLGLVLDGDILNVGFYLDYTNGIDLKYNLNGNITDVSLSRDTDLLSILGKSNDPVSANALTSLIDWNGYLNSSFFLSKNEEVEFVGDETQALQYVMREYTTGNSSTVVSSSDVVTKTDEFNSLDLGALVVKSNGLLGKLLGRINNNYNNIDFFDVRVNEDLIIDLNFSYLFDVSSYPKSVIVAEVDMVDSTPQRTKELVVTHVPEIGDRFEGETFTIHRVNNLIKFMPKDSGTQEFYVSKLRIYYGS